MIPKKNKISKKSFPQVMKGKQFPGGYISVTVSPSLSGNMSHITVIIAKKYTKRSVMRNLVKRLIYREIQQKLPQLPYKTLVIMVKKPIHKDILPDLKQETIVVINNIIHFYETH